MQTAPIIEVFTSIQGEGVLVGQRQIFLRIAGCNLDCVYCDTNVTAPTYAAIYYDEKNNNPSQLPNPLNSATIMQIINELNKDESPPLTVAVTGGEPLTKSHFLRELLPQIKKANLKVLLETNGVLPQHLAQITSYLDYLSMDLKLPSQLKGSDYLSAQREFLSLASQVKGLYLKVVVTAEATFEELLAVLTITDGLADLPPLVLQPVTVKDKIGVETEKVVKWQKELSSRFPQVLVIPQIQVFLGVK